MLLIMLMHPLTLGLGVFAAKLPTYFSQSPLTIHSDVTNYNEKFQDCKNDFFSPHKKKKKTVCFMMNNTNVLLTYDGSLNFKSANKVFLILIIRTILLSFLLLAF